MGIGMNEIATLRDRPAGALGWRAGWLPVGLFLIVTRALLQIPALLGANVLPLAGEVGDGGFGADPRGLPGVWLRWDAGYYLGIARRGYSYHGEELGFFPAYPLLIRLFSAGVPALMPWAGFLIANVAFLLAAALLWDQVRLDLGAPAAWGTLVTLSVFPTALFFSAIYTESLFLLFSVLVYWCAARQRYLLAGACAAAASLTRINGLVLAIIPLVEIWLQRPPRRWPRLIGAGLLSGAGLGLYCAYLWATQGSPLAFIQAQQEFMKRSIAWPWRPVLDSLGVVVAGYGGFRDNWFMRVVSLQDLLAIGLFCACAALAFGRIRPSLAIYSAAALLLLLVSHGPYTLGVYAMSRYVLGIFPGFVVIALLLGRAPRLRWLIWALMAALLCGLTAWFASGRWVA